MNGNHAVTCHWLTPTRIMPHPFSFDADTKPWTCLRDGRPRALDACELAECAHCPRREARTLDDTGRDIAYETWGVGIEVPAERTIDDARRDVVWETFGLRV
ncbi:MAG TPA: hypothetical protein VG871_19285 [Vicinamibacterales bacterium]|nr:hypothetical protein [Vicinamibacterales bacterium]